MKKAKLILAITLILAFLVSMTSCYIVTGQKMNKLQGTYKLTGYTYTPQYERRAGYTPKTYDYVNDEAYKFEDYLIITGSNMGYYVHSDASGAAYVKEVTLSYEYSAEKPGTVEYVIFNDSITVNADDGGYNRLGVAQDSLNYSKSSFDYTQLITKTPMRSETLSISWKKVDDATDLLYVKDQFEKLKFYRYSAFATRGIDSLSITDKPAQAAEDPNQYFFIVIDTADGITTANVYYATKEAPTEQIQRTVNFSAGEDYRSLTVDSVTYSAHPVLSGYYQYETAEATTELRLICNDISKSALDNLVENSMPRGTD